MAIRNLKPGGEVITLEADGYRPLVSICIPVYHSSLEVSRVLGELLDSIEMQDYPYIRVFMSIQDTGNPEDLTHVKDLFARRNNTHHTMYPMAEYVDGPAKNTNTSMALVDEGYIKLMNQDDLLDSPTAISEMVRELRTSGADWLINACIHTDGTGQLRERLHHPLWPGEKSMVEGINRFGCPSVAMFKYDVAPTCDPELLLCMDCDMWIQTYKKVGAPVIRRTADVVIRMWENQLSNQLDYGRSLETDKIYMRKKYGYA